jgi:hypothetical protein
MALTMHEICGPRSRTISVGLFHAEFDSSAEWLQQTFHPANCALWIWAGEFVDNCSSRRRRPNGSAGSNSETVRLGAAIRCDKRSHTNGNRSLG